MRTISDVWFMLTLSPDIVFSLLLALLLISLETTIIFVVFISANKSKVYWAELGIATWNLTRVSYAKTIHGDVKI